MKRNIFPGKTFADPSIRKQNKIYPTSNINLKNKYSPLAKTLTKAYNSVVTHVIYHFCDMSLITACAIFCSVTLDVVCACAFFGDTICLLINRKMIKIVTLVDSHILLTYDICF